MEYSEDAATPEPKNEAAGGKRERIDNNMAARTNGDENGYIVVETVGAFVPFLLLVISILSLVNIITVQARVHYALTQAANTLSVYSYTLELLGIANDLSALDNKANRAETGINEIKNGIDAVLSSIRQTSGSGDEADDGTAVVRAFDWGEELIGDPNEALQLLMAYGADRLWDRLFGELVRPLVGRYLSNGGTSGNEYLLRSRVLNRHTGKVGLAALEFFNHADKNLDSSSLIDRNGNIKLVVEYEIAYTFFGLRLPFEPTLRVAQTVVTKAWLNGSGKGYT